MNRFSLIAAVLLISLVCVGSGPAAGAEHGCPKDRQWRHTGERECRPDHQGRCGKRKGDWYGARRAVNSAGEAGELFKAYFAGQNLTVTDIIEKPWRFEADVKNDSGVIVDRVIVDKRSGRIRSIY